MDRLFAARVDDLDVDYVERWLAELLGADEPRVRSVRERFNRVRAAR